MRKVSLNVFSRSFVCKIACECVGCVGHEHNTQPLARVDVVTPIDKLVKLTIQRPMFFFPSADAANSVLNF